MAEFIENILLGKQYLGIEFFSLDNKDRIALLCAERKKNELIISKKEIFDSTENLLAEKWKFAAVLIINNIQVLQKEVEGFDLNDKKLLHKAFPNITLDDFYYEIWRRHSTSIVSICRKNYVDDLIKSLEKNYRITTVSLGVSAISYISDFSIPSTVTTNTQILELNNSINTITSTILPENKDYIINGLSISNTHLLAFSGILKLLIKKEKSTGSIVEKSTSLFEFYRQKVLFEKGITVGVMFILSILILNFLLFSYYFEKTNEISEIVTISRAASENITKIKARIIAKEEKVKNFTATTASKSSLLINDIVKNLPPALLLLELDYHPLEKKVKEGEAIITQDNLITISGSTLSNDSFTVWVGQLEKHVSIKSVTIVQFGKDQENKTVFTIRVNIK